MYTYDEAYQATLEYFDGDELATKVWVDKYALTDNDTNILEKTPTDMHWRLAKEFARIEKNKFKKPLIEHEIFDLFDHFKYLVPGGRVLFGLGNPYQYCTLSNCYVINLTDSYPGIMTADQDLINISRRGGGVGLDISDLRVSGSSVKNAAKKSTGAVSFMSRFSRSIREVGQHSRRGAAIITISVHHPEIEQFIDIKNNDTSVTGANISIKLTDEFLEAVKHDVEYELRFPVYSTNPSYSKKISARYIWNKICINAHNKAEPGILFWDKILKESPADYYEGFKTYGTNPCSEIPLSKYDSCRLLSLNLYNYVDNPFTDQATLNINKLYKHSQYAMRIMDDLIDLELESIDKIIDKIIKDPEPDDVKHNELNLWNKIKIACKNGRRTGIGITALADCLAALNISYNDYANVIEKINIIFKTIKYGCYSESVELAQELGPFPVWKPNLDLNCDFLLRFKDDKDGLKIYNDMKKYGRRNIAILTCAPAGTISCLTQTSSGIEPVFQLSYKRRKKIIEHDINVNIDFVDKTGDKWQEFDVTHPKVKEWKKITKLSNLDDSPWYNSCAYDIDWKTRIDIQAQANQHIDHSISSTINLPENISIDVIKQIYTYAWEKGLKGITVYRQNCRSGVLIDNNSKTDFNKRPKELDCDVYKVNINNKQYFVLVGLLNNIPYEIFCGKNSVIKSSIKTGKIIRKKKGFYKAIFAEDTEIAPITAFSTDIEEAITRLVSTSLRAKVDLNLVVTQLEKVGGENPEMHSLAKVLSRVLKKYIKDGVKIEGEVCPECGGSLIRRDGCWACENCSFSKCI